MFLLSGINDLSTTATWLMFVGGLVLFFGAGFTIWLYVRKRKNKTAKKSDDFEITEKRTSYQVFEFWNHVIYLFIAFTCIVVGIILWVISISAMV